ncbi:MAG: 50S ribosomal protein L16 [Deltaproteobacteria bacterium]|nr:50S ribosomal protein L16 [Deltaproteobacteria bacterium]MCL5276894.1 50S ribosomal protein L16 [Deltaproteobacteria bacterium]
MLMPSKVKYRKQQRGRMKGLSKAGSTLAFGDIGLQALGRGYMTAKQIEAARIAIARFIKKTGRVWIRVFPDKPFTKKPAETRMGKGKGDPVEWITIVKPGRILYEMEGMEKETAYKALRSARYKLPFATRIVERELVK